MSLGILKTPPLLNIKDYSKNISRKKMVTILLKKRIFGNRGESLISHHGSVLILQSQNNQ